VSVTYVGIDPGWAVGKGSRVAMIHEPEDCARLEWERLTSTQEAPLARLRQQRRDLAALLTGQFPVRIAIEEPRALSGAAQMLCPLLWFLVDTCTEYPDPEPARVLPHLLKAFVAGKGNADKDLMVQDAARLGRKLGLLRQDDNITNDQADALGLALLAWCLAEPDLPQWTAKQKEVAWTVAHPKAKGKRTVKRAAQAAEEVR
jgi:Holliday junction resolvasome RuvABC endonuclease subunit